MHQGDNSQVPLVIVIVGGGGRTVGKAGSQGTEGRLSKTTQFLVCNPYEGEDEISDNEGNFN